LPQTKDKERENKTTPASFRAEPANVETVSATGYATRARDCAGTLFQGWVSLAFWMVVGLLLEGLMAYKTPVYLQDNVRRELFRLAHAHGAVLGLVLIAAALSVERFKLPPARASLIALRLGAVLMPLGFLLGGVWHYESDPGFAIWLVPAGASLLIFGVVSFALASWVNWQRTD
jgi:small-conductance mechanosensitive channel